MRDPHQNIFYYYRGPSRKNKGLLHDMQIEDNTTKAFINLLEFAKRVDFEPLLKKILKIINIPLRQIESFKLQELAENSRPDGIINFYGYKVLIESKVRADLRIEQIERHLKSLDKNDFLLVITNKRADCLELKELNRAQLRYVLWYDIHKACLNVASCIKKDKKSAAIFAILEDFINYLEVIVMTEFIGFKDNDFDFLITLDDHYRPILTNKLESLAKVIIREFPIELSKYSSIRIGNISKKVQDDRFAWVAIKKPANDKDVFNQCNFTVEVSKNSLYVNAVIRNGRTTDKRKPLGVFYKKILKNPDKFLSVIRKIKINSSIIISRRLPKVGKVVRIGNEKWVSFFEIKLHDIKNKEDIRYLCRILQKADIKPALPGVHIRYSINRGEPILTEPEALKKDIIKTIVSFKPILDFLG